MANQIAKAIAIKANKKKPIKIAPILAFASKDSSRI